MSHRLGITLALALVLAGCEDVAKTVDDNRAALRRTVETGTVNVIYEEF